MDVCASVTTTLTFTTHATNLVQVNECSTKFEQKKSTTFKSVAVQNG